MRKRPKRRKAARKRTRAGKRRIASGAARRSARTAYRADQSFELFKELQALVIKAAPDSFPQLEQKLKRLGGIKLAVVTGAFLNINDARVDLLLVGDNVNPRRLTNIVKDLEAELGKEIRYVTLSVSEFKYRYEMYDRFLRDIFDFPHAKVIGRLKL